MSPPEATWWRRGVIYQIYPRSFRDTNGDGVGDLPGICRSLSYLTWLGVDAVWISPIYPSPMADFGYDVADYCRIDPLFGTLADFDQLVAEAHRRRLKVILDFVPNHTSDRHSWFLASRSSRSSPKRDWYIWRDGKADGTPPNNWVSQFGGAAWTFDATTRQYYLHSFLSAQPDLNWRNAAVQAAMFEAMRFWLDRGVDGFRIDVLWLLIKDAALRDNPPNPAYRPNQSAINRFLQVYNSDQPEVHELVARMRSVLDGYPERVLIGEIYLPLDRLVTYYGKDLKGAQLPFNFALLHTAWNVQEVAKLIVEYEAALPPGGWPNWVLGNHDQPRVAARIGSGQARIAAMLLLTLRGTPTMYYGDELGIGRVEVPPEQTQDPWEKNEPGLGVSRDPSRTPFQWTSGANAGFTSARPWLPIDPDYRSRNVESLRGDPASILTLYRALIALRRQHSALTIGDFRLVSSDHDVLAFERPHAGDTMTVVLNFAHEEREVSRLLQESGAHIVLSTHLDRAGSAARLRLRPDEGVILLQSNG